MIGVAASGAIGAGAAVADAQEQRAARAVEREITQAPPGVYPDAERVVVIGSVRGHADRFRNALRGAGLIDQNDDWIGGETHLVQLGELFGQGPSLTGAVELLMRLQEQAREAGGEIHSLHSPSDFATLRGRFDKIAVFGDEEQRYAEYITPRSELKRREWIEKFMAEQAEYNEDEPTFRLLREDFRRNLEQHFGLGAAEFLESIAPGTEMGDWLRNRNAVVKIGDAVYSYAGVSDLDAIRPLEAVNDEIRAKLAEISVWFPSMRDEDNPIWWTDLLSPTAENMDIRLPWIHYQLGAVAQVVSISDQRRPHREGRILHVRSGIDRPGTGQPLAWVERRDGDFFFHTGGVVSDPWTPPPLPRIPPPAPPGLPLQEN